MMLRTLALFLFALSSVAAINDDTRGYLSAMSDFLESHTLGDVELMRVIKACDKGEIVNPILESAAAINPLTLVYREALQSWIAPGRLNATAVCEFAKLRLSDEARQQEERKRAKDKTDNFFNSTPSILSAARDYTCVVQHDNQVVCWGESVYDAHRAPKGLRAKSVVAGPHMACAIRLDDTLACWGDFSNHVTAPPYTLGPVKSVAIGAFSACAVQLNNDLVCWGHQLDLPSNLGTVKSIAAGWLHTCAIRADDTLRCWGSNSEGQLNVPPTLGRVKSVTAGEGYTCAIDSDDLLVCWGMESDGGVTPPQDLGKITLVAGGRWGVSAKRLDGMLVWWMNSAAHTEDIGSFKSVALGDNHICRVGLDNTIGCWDMRNLTWVWSPEGLKALATEATP